MKRNLKSLRELEACAISTFNTKIRDGRFLVRLQAERKFLPSVLRAINRTNNHKLSHIPFAFYFFLNSYLDNKSKEYFSIFFRFVSHDCDPDLIDEHKMEDILSCFGCKAI